MFIIHFVSDSQIDQEDVAKGYVVWNPSCRIPDISPYHDSIKKYISKWKPLICSKNKPLTSTVYSPITKRHTLRVNPHIVHSYSTTVALLTCCYSIITRSYQKKKIRDDDDDRYNISKAVCFKNKIELPPETEYIYVRCISGKKNIYETIHFMVIDKEPKPVTSKEELTEKKFSVFLFAIDSISRLNFMRTLPKTRKYIEERGWLPLEGYTKIADNTFPNLVAILSGMTVSQLTKHCYPSHKQKIDDCPFMWKNFSQNGYLTSYVEDTAPIASFNYLKYGFLNSPTDYYSRPILIAARKYMKIRDDGGMEYCIGPQPQIEYLFQFNTEFIQRFHNRSYFNLFWSNSFSHNEMNMPTIMDDRIRNFLADIEPYLNSTVVVFFSDHGMRFGKARETYVGWLEERMPFIYFYFPPSFQAAHPSWVRNFRANKNKLTSPFDFHATLQDLLYGQQLQPAAGCPQCGSLFNPVPHNRSCDDAGITSHWCTCSVADSSESVSDPHVVAAAHVAIGSINELLQKSVDQIKNDSSCAILSFSKVMSVRTKVGGGFAIFRRREHIIVFETEPSKAVFEVTVPEGSVKISNVAEISRINMYGSQSACVKGGSLLKLFCFCVKK
ncbi:hypothetical protein V9T40_000735 [Parthenolecanium corni]|uniref:Uncharacterized protein n=1 Tax=Parthenolecanium corni TaxID=536013 RepID=A0AAN9Y0P0_9HEMI